jgi:hypothetical protein
MTSLAGTLYDTGVRTASDDGTAVYSPVRAAVQELRQFFTPWVFPAPQRPSHVLDPQRLALELHDWTGWSDRTLAQVLGTSHPTVRALLEGRGATTSRTAAVRARLRAVHEVVGRVYALAGGSASATRWVLSELPLGRTRRSVDYLSAGDMPAAYLAAMDLLRPVTRDAGELLSADWPIRAGEASIELSTEE